MAAMAGIGSERIRTAAVAGRFYPGEAASLARAVDAYLAAAAPPPLGGGVPKALIAPHAGYVYSGPIAASAYSLVRPHAAGIRRVVLLGPAHRVPLAGLAASAATHFETPLGRVRVDGEALAAATALPQVRVVEEAHAGEHSLEVHLPFLQRLLGDFALVPLVAGDAGAAEVAEVLERLWGGDDTLIVVSSDLSHYRDYDTARALDAATTRTIEALDGDGLVPRSACGRVAVRGLLAAARRRGLRAHTLDVRNSGDTAGPRDSVVGYGAWAFARV